MTGSSITALYRTYDLPWTPTQEERSRLRRLLVACLSLTVFISILLPLLPAPLRTSEQPEHPPARLARLVLERRVTPPPPPAPKIDPLPQQVQPDPVRVPQPQPQTQAQTQPAPERAQQARRRAANAGLLPFQDQLASLRENAALDKASANNLLSADTVRDAGDGAARAERSLITSRVGEGSGGINTGALSRGYGAGAGSLSGHETAQVASSIGGAPANASTSADSARRGGHTPRSAEEIALVFDRNKGAIYAIYTRALREKPDLQGKLVLELTIAPDGAVTRCEVVSSELNDPDFERKLVARVKLFKFEARNVGTITVTKPIDFFPA